MINHLRQFLFFNRICGLLLAFCAALACTPAGAEVVSLRFTGTANSVGASLQPYFQVGDSFTYTLSYDTTAIGTFSGTYSRTFQAISAVFTVNATGGTWSTNLSDPEIQLEDDPSYSRFQVNAGFDEATVFSNPTVNGNTLSNMNLGLYSDDINMVTGFSLPATLGLTGWSTSPSSSGVFSYWEPGTGDYFMRFSFTGVENLSAIPEPSSFALLLGLGVLGGVVSRRRRSRETFCRREKGR